jgi:hypothetical protein
LKGETGKILTTNCFTRRDRLYHPSDMFLCGSGKLLKEYYSLPYQTATHRDVQLRIMEMENNGVSQRLSMLHAPESMLFKHFLSVRNWDFKFTDEDSLAAIRKYCHLVNSWDIDYCWSKKRTPFIKEGGLILPQNGFVSRPFEGGPEERNACYNSWDVYDEAPTLTDRKYYALSKALFGLSEMPAGWFFKKIITIIYERKIQNIIPILLRRFSKKVSDVINPSSYYTKDDTKPSGSIYFYFVKIVSFISSFIHLLLLLPFLLKANKK